VNNNSRGGLNLKKNRKGGLKCTRKAVRILHQSGQGVTGSEKNLRTDIPKTLQEAWKNDRLGLKKRGHSYHPPNTDEIRREKTRGLRQKLRGRDKFAGLKLERTLHHLAKKGTSQKMRG